MIGLNIHWISPGNNALEMMVRKQRDFINLAIALNSGSKIEIATLEPNLLSFVKKLNWLRAAGYAFVLIAYLLSLTNFLDAYFVHLPKHDAKFWLYGYKQTVKAIAPIQDNYEKIIFQQSYNQPYIYFLFHQKYDPAKYQVQAELTEGGIDVGLVEKLDNISFEFFSWPVRIDEKVLIVGDSVAIPDNFSTEDYKLISDIKYPDGLETAFRIIELQ
ncbi:hypothetical protein IID22_04665 [Patescibacteria group bacterium]|nr:hypothetical protein [Patescibacteria group bacterium]